MWLTEHSSSAETSVLQNCSEHDSSEDSSHSICVEVRQQQRQHITTSKVCRLSHGCLLDRAEVAHLQAVIIRDAKHAFSSKALYG